MPHDIQLGPSTVWIKSGYAWCGVCGSWTRVYAEIFYPANAARDTETSEYFRICEHCISAIHAFIADSGEEQA